MRCEIVRRTIEENLATPPGVRAHLSACRACAEYARQWQSVRAGLVALGREEPPEATLGFAQRLTGRLAYARAESQRGQQFLINVGRRMVYATLMVAVILVLGLLLPSSGPWRSRGIAQAAFSENQTVLANDETSNEQFIGVDYTLPPGPAAANQSQGTR
jgi:anti-sigma factor RsiW